MINGSLTLPAAPACTCLYFHRELPEQWLISREIRRGGNETPLFLPRGESSENSILIKPRFPAKPRRRRHRETTCRNSSFRSQGLSRYLREFRGEFGACTSHVTSLKNLADWREQFPRVFPAVRKSAASIGLSLCPPRYVRLIRRQNKLHLSRLVAHRNKGYDISQSYHRSFLQLL